MRQGNAQEASKALMRLFQGKNVAWFNQTTSASTVTMSVGYSPKQVQGLIERPMCPRRVSSGFPPLL